ncbi:hypothetical protein IG631_12458 [Alternaria alternata]|nr:hypothetical protein IG631_12458 [Alternaria alternata]
MVTEVAERSARYLYSSKWETKRVLFSTKRASDAMIWNNARIQDVTAECETVSVRLEIR